MPLTPAEVELRARRIRLLLLDVDGVLTSGHVGIASGGGETKFFSIRDGLGIVWARRVGLDVGLLSGRPSDATTRRAAELGLSMVVQGSSDKRAGYSGILTTHGYTDDEVAYMGDDLVDLPVLGRVGLATAPADAASDVKHAAHWISQQPGGHGAVRELIELLLKAQGHWDDLVRSYQV